MNYFPRTVVLLLVLLFCSPATATIAAAATAGVPVVPIWFSKDPFNEGDAITIFAPLYNSTQYRFSGTFVLRDGTTTIGTQPFVIAADGASRIFAFPWKATSGTHAFSVTVVGGEFLSSDKSFVDLPITMEMTEVLKRFVPPPPAPTPAPSQPTTKAGEQATGTPLSEKTTVTQYLDTKIPASLRADALPIIGGVENFRLSQVARAESMEREAVAVLAPESAPKATTGSAGWAVFAAGVAKGDVIHTPWEYAKLFFILCYQFVTTNVYAFYILCSYILYRLVRLAVNVFS
jgi:hypothetical protein